MFKFELRSIRSVMKGQSDGLTTRSSRVRMNLPGEYPVLQKDRITLPDLDMFLLN